MKRKVENWGYSELEAGELEQHLNDMAGKGYVLRWANSSGIHNASDCVAWWYMIIWIPAWLHRMRYCANLTYICSLERRSREDRD